MLEATHLRTEYRRNPHGIGVTVPRLSWALTSDEPLQKQRAFRLLVVEPASIREYG